jgi:hypothetical protein
MEGREGTMADGASRRPYPGYDSSRKLIYMTIHRLFLMMRRGKRSGFSNMVSSANKARSDAP